MCFHYSCNNSPKSNNEKAKKVVENRLNDSLDIKIFFDEKNHTIRTIIIKNSNTLYANIYGFHDDGITPALIGREKNGVSDGLYFTYYSSGFLNIKMNYTDGEIDGEYVSYSEQGDAIYKAYYKKGVEEQVEIKDSITFEPEIKEMKQ